MSGAAAAAVQACYMVNDTLAQLWDVVGGRAKDYIVQPKGNGYQSLHTTLLVTAPQPSAGGAAASVLSQAPVL